MRLIRAFILALPLVCGCQEQPHQADIPVFDLHSFFDEQSRKLSALPVHLKKEMRFGNKATNLIIESPVWEKELSPFLAIDLRKPSYHGRLKRDSVSSGNGYTVTYSATDKKMDVKEVRIEFAPAGRPTAIHIFQNDRNNLYESERQMRYQVDSGFSIEGRQKVKLINEVEYAVKARFIKP